jgi:hypothetical protein
VTNLALTGWGCYSGTPICMRVATRSKGGCVTSRSAFGGLIFLPNKFYDIREKRNFGKKLLVLTFLLQKSWYYNFYFFPLGSRQANMGVPKANFSEKWSQIRRLTFLKKSQSTTTPKINVGLLFMGRSYVYHELLYFLS